MIKDCIKDGQTTFKFDITDTHFILTNQPDRNANCSFKCDQKIEIKNGILSELLVEIESTNQKFILTNKMSEKLNIIFS